MSKLLVSGLFIYPVKSLGGISLTESYIGNRGLMYDRRWMLIDDNHKFITQRANHRLALLQTELGDNQLKISSKNDRTRFIDVPLNPAPVERINVNVWDDICEAEVASKEINIWLSHTLEMSCRLVYMPEDSLRKVDKVYAKNNEITAFSDGYPIMLIGEASLDDLNNRLAQPVPMNRFRPNIIFKGGYPYQEDNLHKFSINNLSFLGVKLCGRCVITTINQNDGISSDEPLRTLSTYRKKENKVLFGQNVLPVNYGIVRIGDEIHIV